MKNFSTARKLFTSFLIIILLFGMLLAGIVAFGMRSISSKFSGFYDGPYQVVDTAEQLNKSLHALEEYALMMITAPDAEKSLQYEKEFNTRANDADNEIAFLKKKLTLKSDKDRVAEMIQASEEGQEIDRKMINLIHSGEADAAREIYFSESIPAAQKSRDLSNAINASSKKLADQYYEQAQQAEKKAYAIIGVFSLIILACAVLLCGYVVRGITKPVKEVEGAMKKLSDGKFDVSVTYTSKDELGGLADSVRTMVGKLRGYIENIAYVMGEISNGNMAVSIDVDYQNDFAPIKQSMETIIASLNDTLSQISASSQQVAAGSDQMSAGAQGLAQGATEQASSSEELASSITEISRRVQQNASDSQQARADMDETIQRIQQGKEQMKKLVSAMNQIANTSSEIEKIIKTIEDIAFQTNILSLNAAVEAARAGSAGKGFSVVADEVRNLANKSAAAAKDTAALIKSALTAIGTGEKMVEETGKALASVSAKAESAAKLVNEIAEDSNSQASSIEQINIGINQISTVIQTNTATAEESAASSEELSAQATMLQTMVSKFKLTDKTAAAGSKKPEKERVCC